MNTAKGNPVELDIYELIKQLGLDAERWRKASLSEIIADKPAVDSEFDEDGDAE
ncbi:hypothetical protein SAMN02799630_02493 [Paenibacillus sp. UNCCL117]|uniref:valine--tRNA ligase n=1 Tax=unclassified Paenibacillus TaxID=185978 RepID=UPI0008901CC9|nr:MULTISPECIES: valine--tRNA ligase [unclassified Paenibacillus]SDC03525.1 hypothetical protein SAMN04488602_101162 [Paenibacillus sp. cl123]SFW37097.1 hypothetical protein SAMN02799630_02493 [Paenibacillus sp. UNCCL117]